MKIKKSLLVVSLTVLILFFGIDVAFACSCPSCPNPCEYQGGSCHTDDEGNCICNCHCDPYPRCHPCPGGHCDGSGTCDTTPPTLTINPSSTIGNKWINYNLTVTFSCSDNYACCPSGDPKCNAPQWCVMRWDDWGKYDLGDGNPTSCMSSWVEIYSVSTVTLDDHSFIMLKGEDINCNPATAGPYEFRIDETGGVSHSWCEPPAKYEWTNESIDLTFNFSDQGDSGPDVVGFGYYLADASGNMFYYWDDDYFDCFSNPPGPSPTDGDYCDPDVACNSNTKSVYCEKTITFNTKNPPLGGDCGDGCDYLFTCLTTYDTAGNFLGAWDVADDYTAADLKPPEVWLTGVSGGGKVIVSLHCRDDESGCDPSSYMIYETGDTNKTACESTVCSLPCPGVAVGMPPVEFYSDVCVCGYARDNVGHENCSGTKI